MAPFVRTSIKHGIQPGMAVRFALLQDGDTFRYPDADGPLYTRTRSPIVYANLPRSNAILNRYHAETFADDTPVIATAPWKSRDDFPLEQTVRFGDLHNGDEFRHGDTLYRKRTDWYEHQPVVSADGTTTQRLMRSSANAVDYAVKYPNFADDAIVIFESDATEDLSKYDWIWQSD